MRKWCLLLLALLSTQALSWNITTNKQELKGNENAIMVLPVSESKMIGFKCKEGRLSLTYYFSDQRTLLKKDLYGALIFKIDGAEFRMEGPLTRQNILSIGITLDDHETLLTILKLLAKNPKGFYVLEELEYAYRPYKIGLYDPVSSVKKFTKLCNIAL
ncbi:hypothetical protein [Symbiopectobacterium purcellii]|uniref:Uncharacterized protein n=1 Tax=Symbiopectobacterium purcellii TaxID=2871826 RepID=A0ABX9AVA0_9ENTR|nr:hypothetical protein [Symbiopectobacterium purcellii]QZN97359.1 hypothetical protein K6K13_08465 [Symbiopectobacterium purcellii]